jgi:hypothetical protein
MKRIQVAIQGASSLLMHRFGEQAEADVARGTSHAITRPTAAEAAEQAAYRMKTGDNKLGNLYVPTRALLAAMRQAAGLHRIGRRGARSIVCAAVFIDGEELDLGTKDYTINSQPVVIRATKGRILRHRPQLHSWKLSFMLSYREDLIQDEGLLRRILEDAGAQIGLLDFRPQCGGPHGTFVVSRWQPVK